MERAFAALGESVRKWERSQHLERAFAKKGGGGGAFAHAHRPAPSLSTKMESPGIKLRGANHTHYHP